MKFNGVEVPASGQKITLSGKDLVVPDNPIIPFIEGDGTGRDIWKASQLVFDAAVEKVSAGFATDPDESGSHREPGSIRRRCVLPP